MVSDANIREKKKRVDNAALSASPQDTHEREKAIMVAFSKGYCQGKNETIRKACAWLREHTKHYVGPVDEPFFSMFIKHFRKAIEE